MTVRGDGEGREEERLLKNCAPLVFKEITVYSQLKNTILTPWALIHLSHEIDDLAQKTYHPSLWVFFVFFVFLSVCEDNISPKVDSVSDT